MLKQCSNNTDHKDLAFDSIPAVKLIKRPMVFDDAIES